MWFNIKAPIRGYEPLVPPNRRRRLQWDYQIHGTYSVRVLPGMGANVATARVVPRWPAGPVPNGLLVPVYYLMPPGSTQWPCQPIETHVFDGHCQRADREVARLRQSYLPAPGAVPAPGMPGFTGFSLRDLRSIAKSFGEPSMYTIQG